MKYRHSKALVHFAQHKKHYYILRSIKIIDDVEERKALRCQNKKNYIHISKQRRNKAPQTNYDHSHELRNRGKKKRVN